MLEYGMTLHEIIDAVKKLPEADQAKLRDEVWPADFVPTEQQRADIHAAQAQGRAGDVIDETELRSLIRRRG